MNQLAELLNKIETHHHEYPDHGINCACMDEHVRFLRGATKVDNPMLQRRIDHVFRAALENRR